MARQSPKRRTFLRSAGAGAAVLLAGCSNQQSGNGQTTTVDEGDGGTPADGEDGGATTTGGGDPLNFGVLVPFSGDLAAYGEYESRAVEAAIAEVNAAGGVNGREVQVRLQDTEDQPQIALSGFQTLLDQDIFGMYGPFSNTIPSIISDIGSSDVIDFSSAGVPSLDTRSVDNVFRVMSTDSDALRAEVTYIAENYDTIATANLNNQNHNQAMDIITNGAPAVDVEIAESVVMEPDADTFRSSIRQLQNASADAVVAFVGTEKGPLFIRQYREMGVEADVIMSNDIVPIDLERAGVDNMEGVVGARPGTGPAYEQFSEMYLSRVDREDPAPFAHVAWDSATVACLAAEAAEELTRDALVEQVRNVALEGGTEVMASFADGRDELQAGNEINYEGGVSACEFDQYGDATQPIQMVQVQDGEWVQIDTYHQDDMAVDKDTVLN